LALSSNPRPSKPEQVASSPDVHQGLLNRRQFLRRALKFTLLASALCLTSSGGEQMRRQNLIRFIKSLDLDALRIEWEKRTQSPWLSADEIMTACNNPWRLKREDLHDILPPFQEILSDSPHLSYCDPQEICTIIKDQGIADDVNLHVPENPLHSEHPYVLIHFRQVHAEQKGSKDGKRKMEISELGLENQFRQVLIIEELMSRGFRFLRSEGSRGTVEAFYNNEETLPAPQRIPKSGGTLFGFGKEWGPSAKRQLKKFIENFDASASKVLKGMYQSLDLRGCEGLEFLAVEKLYAHLSFADRDPVLSKLNVLFRKMHTCLSYPLDNSSKTDVSHIITEIESIDELSEKEKDNAIELLKLFMAMKFMGNALPSDSVGTDRVGYAIKSSFEKLPEIGKHSKAIRPNFPIWGNAVGVVFGAYHDFAKRSTDLGIHCVEVTSTRIPELEGREGIEDERKRNAAVWLEKYNQIISG
jgi:hypothetical protein